MGDSTQASQHDPPRITRVRANMGVDYTRDEPAPPNIAMEPTARRKSSYAPRLIARSLCGLMRQDAEDGTLTFEGAGRMLDLVRTKREQILRLARRHGV